jgi:hypothetical protein
VVISSPVLMSCVARRNIMSPMKVRTLFGRQSWLMYEVRIQKPLRTGVEALGKQPRGGALRND